MKHEFVERAALEAAIDHLKNHQTTISKLKEFAMAVLALSDKHGAQIPNEAILTLAESYPDFTGQLLQNIKSEAKEREAAMSEEIRKKISS
ncbi:MAG: hypothetical protein PHS79_04650 [Patescibacteria group bacterium]|nr:hypothetical protein [Patescibacteria group bacterium]